MQLVSKENSQLATANLGDLSLTTGNFLNAILMALEGFGKHAMEEGHEVRALIELAQGARASNNDIQKSCGVYD